MKSSKEVKVALTLKKNGQLTTTETSKISGVKYSTTYRVLRKLTKWGFVKCMGRDETDKGNPALSWKLLKDTNIQDIKERYQYLKGD